MHSGRRFAAGSSWRGFAGFAATRAKSSTENQLVKEKEQLQEASSGSRFTLIVRDHRQRKVSSLRLVSGVHLPCGVEQKGGQRGAINVAD